ncbi:MAG TPA: DUF1345 domain-containing protein [Candidatus Binatia bacterium]|nr:DUF1345 domain-containing protein [Candidatus Binatia bacterium]
MIIEYCRSLPPRNRLLLSYAVALLTFLISLPLMRFMTCLVLTWSVGIIFWLLLVSLFLFTASPEEVMRRAQLVEARRGLILATVAASAVASLIAMAFMLANTQDWPPLEASVHLSLSLVAVFASWLFVHVGFTLSYARLYYDELEPPAPMPYKKGLQYPTDDPPDYWDFLYFSFTIAMCAQTSDVSVTSAPMRRLALVHSFVSFIFYTIILGLVLNGVSTLI